MIFLIEIGSISKGALSPKPVGIKYSLPVILIGLLVRGISVFNGNTATNLSCSRRYTDSFLVKSSTYFLNCLSVVERLSTVLQA